MENESDWCNCQAIEGSENYSGPWHERGGAPHYPCSQSSAEDEAQRHARA